MSRACRRVLIVPLVAAAFSLPARVALAQAREPAADRIVAEVGTRKITVADVRDELVSERRRATSETALALFGSGAPESALNRLVDIKLLALGATDRKLDADPDVKRRLDNVLDEALAAILIAQLSATVPITRDALRAYYDQHLTAFSTPGRVRARHVVVGSRPEAEQLRGQLEKGADFAAVATAHNTDATARTGGDLGWISPGVMVPAFEQAVFALRPGEMSGIVQTMFGFHIVKVEEKEPGKPKPFDDVLEAVRQHMLDDVLNGVKQELRNRHIVKVDKDALEGVRR